MSAEHDRLIIKALRTAIFVAWLVAAMLVINVIISATRSCPPCEKR